MRHSNKILTAVTVIVAVAAFIVRPAWACSNG